MDLHCGASLRQDLVLEEDVSSRAVVSLQNSEIQNALFASLNKLVERPNTNCLVTYPII